MSYRTKSKIAFFDFDNTLLNGYSTSNFYEFLAKNKYVSSYDEVIRKHKKALADFTSEKVNYDKSTDIMMGILGVAIKNLTENEFQNLIIKFIKSGKVKLYDYAIPLLQKIHRLGFDIYIISAAVPMVIKTYLKDLDVEHKILGTEYELDPSGKFTGRHLGVLNASQKSKVIAKIKKGAVKTISFGDSEGDLPMLNATDYAFLLHPRSEKLLTQINKKQVFVINNIADEVISNICSRIGSS